MTRDEFNSFCGSLPATHHVVQWGGSEVWKVGGAKGAKVFAIGGWNAGGAVLGITFKVSPLSFEILTEQPGLRPAPYLASRGFTWVQHHSEPGLDDAALRDYLAVSHRIVAAGLSRKVRRELGLEG